MKRRPLRQDRSYLFTRSGRLTLIAVLWLSLGLASSTLMAAPSLGEVPVPFNASIELISDSTVHNGRAVSMATFDAPQDVDSTVAFYRNAWPDIADSDRPGMIVTRIPGWLLLSQLSGGYNTVVQLSLETTHRSTGYISIMPVVGNITDRLPTAISELPVKLLSETNTDDGFSSSQLSVYSSSLSVTALAEQFVRLRQGQQWSVTSRQSHDGSEIVLMKAKGQQLELVVSRNDSGDFGRSVAVLNEVTSQ